MKKMMGYYSAGQKEDVGPHTLPQKDVWRKTLNRMKKKSSHFLSTLKNKKADRFDNKIIVVFGNRFLKDEKEQLILLLSNFLCFKDFF